MKVLFAHDGLPPAEEARKVLSKLADPAKIDLTVLTVSPLQMTAYPEVGAYVPSSAERSLEHATKTANDTVEDLEADGFNCAQKVIEGDPSSEILRLGDEEDFDLILMGAGSKSWLGHMLLGSVSTRVLHGSRKSVMIVRQALWETYRSSVLLGADGSKESMLAAKVAAEFLNSAACDVFVTTIVRRPVYPSLAPPLVPYPVQPKDDDKLVREAIERGVNAANRAASFFRTAGFKTEVDCYVGHPTADLLKEASNYHADLVAVGSRGLGAIRRVALGSVSDQMVRHAPATLVARSPEH